MTTERKIFLTVALLLATNVSLFGAGADSMSRNMGELTIAMVDDHSFRLDRFMEAPLLSRSEEIKDKAQYQGHLFSGSPPGTSFLMVPVYVVLKPALWLAGRGRTATQQTQLAFLTLMAASALLVALAVAAAAMLVFRFAMMLGADRRLGIAAAFALVPGSWLMFYGTHVSGKAIAAVLTFTAFYLAARGAGRIAATAAPVRDVLLAGLAAGVAVSVDYASVLAIPVIGLYLLALRGWRPFVAFGIGLLLPAIATAWYHHAALGGVLVTSYDRWGPGRAEPSTGMGLPAAEVVYGLLISPYKGILFHAPWIAIACAAAVTALRGPRKPEVLAAAAIAAATIFFNLAMGNWWAGYFWGPRYTTMALPFLALLLALAAGRWRVAVWSLVLFSTLLNFLPVLHGGVVLGERPWDNPVTLYGTELLTTGAGTYWLRFLSRNVHPLGAVTLTLLEFGLLAATVGVIALVWRRAADDA